MKIITPMVLLTFMLVVSFENYSHAARGGVTPLRPGQYSVSNDSGAQANGSINNSRSMVLKKK